MGTPDATAEVSVPDPVPRLTPGRRVTPETDRLDIVAPLLSRIAEESSPRAPVTPRSLS